MTGRQWTREETERLIDSAPVPMTVSHGELLVRVNHAYTVLMDLPAEVVEGKPWPQMLPPEERSRIRERGRRQEAQARPASSTFEMILQARARRFHALVRTEFVPADVGGFWALSIILELPHSAHHRRFADLLTEVAAAMIEGRSVAQVQEAAVRQFRASGLAASFLRPPFEDAEDAEAQEALAARGPVFGGAESSMPRSVFLPIDGSDGEEVLKLEGLGLTSTHAPTLSLFSRLVGSAVASGRMFEHLQAMEAASRQKLSESELLLDLAKTTSSTLELGAILDAACDSLVRLLDVSNCFILLADEQARVLKGAAASSAHRAYFRTVEISLDEPSAAATAARRMHPVMIADVAASPGATHSELVRRFGEKALLALPLISRDELLGVVVVDDVRGPRTFSAHTVHLAEASIAQLALSVANARLYASLKESYAHLAAARAEVVKRERLAALGELSAIVAHEVRNPLGVIFNAVNSIRRAPLAHEDVGMLVGIIGEESDRLNRIVGDLLDFARPQPLALQFERIERFIEDALDAVRGDESLRTGIELVADVEADLPPVPMDRHVLRQAFTNVLLNAAQSMPHGGDVRVRARRDPQDPEHFLSLEVSDQGVGIPGELIERVFEPFFTTKARGTGLGLAVVRRIVEDHQGVVQIRSEAGRGTTFILRLPLPSPIPLAATATGGNSRQG